MTDAEKVMALRTMIDNSEDYEPIPDDVLSAYLEQAKYEVLNRAYPFDNTITEVPARYERIQLDIASYLLNKRGAEGEMTHTEIGQQRTYESGGVPSSLLRGITPMCGVIK